MTQLYLTTDIPLTKLFYTLSGAESFKVFDYVLRDCLQRVHLEEKMQEEIKY